MGIFTHHSKDMDAYTSMDRTHKSDSMISYFGEEEMFNAHTSVTSDDIWKKFDLLTPPLSPRRDGADELDLENVTMPFDLDTEDLMAFDEVLAEAMKLTFPESPPSVGDVGLQANLIQDIMWSAPLKIEDIGKDVKSRRRCDSCSSGSFNAACVAPEDIFPYESNMAGPVVQSRNHLHGLETPSDSEEEIDVVTVEKQYQVTVPAKRKCQDVRYDQNGTKTVTLTIERKPVVSSQTLKSCPTVVQKVDCPTDVHNYSLPVTSIKRVRSFPNSPLTHKSAKKLKRDSSIPSDLRKVAQKLVKSSVGSSGSRSSSDSEDFCESGKRTQHNVLERKRRTDLKNSFFHLRDSVPELEGQERAAKVVILRKASQYIHKLIDEQHRLEHEAELLKIRKEKLKRQLHRLRDY